MNSQISRSMPPLRPRVIPLPLSAEEFEAKMRHEGKTVTGFSLRQGDLLSLGT